MIYLLNRKISDYNKSTEIYYFNHYTRYKAITCLDECIDKMKILMKKDLN